MQFTSERGVFHWNILDNTKGQLCFQLLSDIKCSFVLCWISCSSGFYFSTFLLLWEELWDNNFLELYLYFWFGTFGFCYPKRASYKKIFIFQSIACCKPNIGGGNQCNNLIFFVCKPDIGGWQYCFMCEFIVFHQNVLCIELSWFQPVKHPQLRFSHLGVSYFNRS